MRSRVVIVLIFFIAIWCGLIFRAAFLQVIPNARLSDLQRRQFETVVTLEPRRGDIFDRNGQELAVSVPAYSIFADPTHVVRPRFVASKLSSLLGQPYSELIAKLKSKPRRFVWIKRRVNRAQRDIVAKLNLVGVGFVEETQRVYPNEVLGGQLLGFVGSEGKGLEGVEARYDEDLRGIAKKMNMQRDARGRPLVIQGQVFSERPDGASLQLTIDRELQYNLEQELKAVVDQLKADHAVGIILDPQNSEILAMASMPTFNPNEAHLASADTRRNRTITDPIEAGSTMKSFTVSAGVRDGTIQPNSQFFCENGFFQIGKKVIHEADEKHRFGWLSTNEILEHSSNIGSSKIALQLGAAKLRQTLLDFGFGNKLGVDISGESRGILPPLPWNDHLIANISFGHGIGTTPLQIANAYGAIANGGVLHRPYLVKRISNMESDEVKESKPEEIRRVMSREDATKMTLMLIGTTTDGGTGKRARVPGYQVAGKTGTAQKADLVHGGYTKGQYVSSFAGYIPAHDPKFVIYIAVDSPKGIYYGSDVAAPVFSKVAAFAIRKSGIPPVSLAKDTTKKEDFKGGPFSKNESRVATALQQAALQEKNAADDKTPLTTMPNLLGLNVRDLLMRIHNLPGKVDLHGTGTVSRTEPVAGAPVTDQDHITIELKNEIR